MKYRAILIDPPVSFKAYSENSNTPGRRASAHYSTMDWTDLAELGPMLHRVAHPDGCAMFLWVCAPLLAETLKLATTGWREDVTTMQPLTIKSKSKTEVVLPAGTSLSHLVTPGWGWEYKTVAFTWVKLTNSRTFAQGLGFWTRANAELVWLLTKGSPKRKSKGVAQVVSSPFDEQTADSTAVLSVRGRHSAKPEEIHSRIEQLVDGPYLEVFARRRKPGWTTVGYELDGLDVRESLLRVASDEELPQVDHTIFEV